MESKKTTANKPIVNAGHSQLFSAQKVHPSTSLQEENKDNSQEDFTSFRSQDILIMPLRPQL